MQEHPIGDGAGTIGIPAGWKITSSSNVGAVAVTGPGRQDVSLGLGLEVVTPDSMAAATQRQLSYGGQVNPAMRLLVAPYTAPVDARRI